MTYIINNITYQLVDEFTIRVDGRVKGACDLLSTCQRYALRCFREELRGYAKEAA